MERRQRGGDEGEKERERKREEERYKRWCSEEEGGKKGDGPRAMVQEEARDGARQKKSAVRKRKRRA